jgi:hypothetical protein
MRSNISSVGILINPYTGSFIIFFLFNVLITFVKVLNKAKTQVFQLLIFVNPCNN